MKTASKQRLQGYLLLTLAMMTVGSTVIASKWIATSVPPFAATALRLAIALPILLGLLALQGGRLPRLGRRAWALLLVQASAGSVGYTALLIAGLAYLPAADAGVLIGTLPAMAALFSIAVLGERPGWRILASVLLASAGALSVAGRGAGSDSLLGSALVLGAVACESAFILLNKRMQPALSPLQQSTLMCAIGLLVALPLALPEFPALSLSQTAWAAITWYALVPTVGGFLLWYAGAARVSGSEAASFTAVAPVTAVALASFTLGEAIAPAQYLGLGAVAAAIAVLVLPRRARAPAAPPMSPTASGQPPRHQNLAQ